MQRIVLSLVSLFVFATSCNTPYYTKSDVFTDQATLQADEPLHVKNSLEWWYLTGHLQDKNSDNTYGIEYVFFHTTPLGKSDYTLMNFAISDPQKQAFYYDYQFDRLKKRMKPALPISFATENEGAPCSLLVSQEIIR